MVRKHNLYDFNAFKIFDICFMAQDKVGLSECSMSTWGVKKGYSAVMKWSILYVSIRSHWLTAWFRSSLFLLICILEILSAVKRKVLKSPTIAVDLSIFPFSSISFAS